MFNNAMALDQAEGLRHLSRGKATRVIAITAGKGGVGKTNVSVNLALTLAKQNKKVMLFDGDLGLANIDVLLGLNAKYNLSHVLDDKCELKDIILTGPYGVKIVPSSSGIDKMTNLGSRAYSGIISAFNTITEPLDYLIIDTAAGISEDVCSFSRSAQELIIVVCDEPTSITDAYALMKVLSRRYHIKKFHILANMVRESSQGRNLFSKLYRAAEQFLDINLDYMGAISYDEFMHMAVKKQQGIIDAYPNALASREFKRITDKILNWPKGRHDIDKQNFFLEQLLQCQLDKSSS